MIDTFAPLSGTTSTGRVQGGTLRGTAGAHISAGADFGTELARIAADAVQTLKTAESTSLAGLQGKTTAQKVVEAVLAAEQTLQTAIAIRDKAVNAYLEVSRMQI